MELKARRGQGLACQLAHQAHLIQVALAGVFAVQTHLDVGHIGHAASQALVKRGKSRAHLGDGGGHRAVAPVNRAHLLGRAVHQAQLVLLNDFFGLKEDAVGCRAACPTGLHLADHGSGRRGHGGGVAHQRETLQLALPCHGGVLQLDHAVGHKEDVVAAGHRGGGEDDVVDLGQPSLTGLRRADVHADWCGLFAQGAQRELLDLGAAGLGRLQGANGGVHGCGLGRDRDVRDRHACQRCHKLDDKTVIAVARDRDIAHAHARQLLEGRLERGQQPSGGGGVVDDDLCRAAQPRQGERAHQIQRDLELELGVDLDGLLGLRRQRQAFVDMHQHVACLQGEVLQTNEPGTDGRGL